MAITEEQRQRNRQRTNLKILHSQIRADYSFKKIVTWNDLYTKLGLKVNGEDKPLVFQELKDYLQKQLDELETTGKVSAPEIKVEQDFKFVQVSAPASSNDWNDCTVLALMTTTGLSYQKAQDFLTEEGRKTGFGLRSDWLSEALTSIGFVLQNTSTGIPLKEAVNTHCSKGKYLVRTRNHAFAIIDGVVHDWKMPEPDTKIERIYLLVPKAIEEEPKKDLTFDASNDYGYKYSPNAHWFAHWFQKKASAELEQKVFVEKKRGILFVSATGTGKTFVAADIIRKAFDRNWHEGKTFSHVPYLYITKSSILMQTNRVFENFFNLKPNIDFSVINIEQLRSKEGRYWVKEEVKIKGGREVVEWKWKKHIQPCITLVDESQGTKNKKAKQSQIIHAYNDIEDNTCLICISATPFARVSEAKSFACSTRRPLEHLGFPKGSVLCNETWDAYSAMIASPSKPEDFCEASVDRLMRDLADYVVRVKGVKPQYKAINGVKIIPFESEEKRIFYTEAIERFEREKKKIDAAKDMGDSAGICYLTILLKYAMAAELNHADGFADMMYEAVTQRGKAAVCAVKFKQTLIAIVRRLNEKYGVSRDDISLIWGGGQTKQTKKQKAKEKLKSLKDKFAELGVDVNEMLIDTGLDEVDDRVIIDLPEHLRLGSQDRFDRQREIDKFQAGKTLYCIYTLKSGGVGLSLHHTDELTEFKCRRKPSGYVVEEDIAKVPVRPRETFIVVTYNAIELVQGVGRVPRLTSLSDTIQNVYCYSGTVEVDMGRIYSQKLRCLVPVVRQREDWTGIMFGGARRNQIVEEILRKTENEKADENTLVDEGEIDDDDE